MRKQEPETSGDMPTPPAQTRLDAWITPARIRFEGGYVCWRDEPDETQKAEGYVPTPVMASAPGLLVDFCRLGTAADDEAGRDAIRDFLELYNAPEICRHGWLPWDTRHRMIEPSAGETIDPQAPCLAEWDTPDEQRLSIDDIARVARGYAGLLAAGRALRPAKPHPAEQKHWEAVWAAFGSGPVDRDLRRNPKAWKAFDLTQQRLELTGRINRLLDDTHVQMRLEWDVWTQAAGPKLRIEAWGCLATSANELSRRLTSGTFDEREAQCVVCARIFAKSKAQQVTCGDNCRREWKSKTRKLNRDRERRRKSHESTPQP